VTVRAWARLLRGAVAGFFANDSPLAAAAIAYYILLSVFPLTLLVLTIGSQLLDPAQVQKDLVTFFNQYIAGSRAIVAGMVNSLDQHTTSFGLVGLLGAGWAGMGIFGALRTALNLAWGVRETRSFWSQRRLELGMAGIVGLFFAISSAATWAVDDLVARGHDRPYTGLRFLIGAAIAFAAFALCYHLIPNTRRRPWRASLQAALFATVLFELAKFAFLAYIRTYANYSLVYGTLGAVIVFLVWAYASATILLFGGQLARELAARK